RFFGPMWQEGDPLPPGPGVPESGAETEPAVPDETEASPAGSGTEQSSESGADRQGPADNGTSLLQNPLLPVVLILVVIIVVILVRTFSGRKDGKDEPPREDW
ncbi:MAG: hypothetical protein J6Z38_04225, partial [Lachnospiraceae bacterium]|nr:hypothetical protein [Lachnospiraceae bacterium]